MFPFPTVSADARALQGWVCRMCANVCVPQSSQTALNKSCPVDGIRDGWNSPLLFVRWEQPRPVGEKITPQFRLSVCPAAEMTLFPWKLKYLKKETGWVLLRWVGGFTSGEELQRSNEVSADCRSPQLNIPLPPQPSIAHSLKMTLPSSFCLSPVLFSLLYAAKCLFFSVFVVGVLLILISEALFFSRQFNY